MQRRRRVDEGADPPITSENSCLCSGGPKEGLRDDNVGAKFSDGMLKGSVVAGKMEESQMPSHGTIPGFFIVALAFIGTSQAASFDCAKAQTKVEKLICSNPTLSKADDALAAAYKKAMAAAATTTEQNE